MGKQERNEAQQAINNQNNSISQRSNELGSNMTSQQQGLQNSANQNQSGAQQGFGNAQSTGNFDPAQLAKLNSSFGDIGATGGANSPQMQSSTNDLNSARGNYTGAGTSFQNMANTGGFTPEQSAAYMRQATSAAPALYQNLAQNLQQRQMGSGGYSPGGTAALLSLQRGAANQLGTLNTAAESGLNQQINANKLAGAQGLTGVASGQANQGMGEGNLSNALAQLRLQGTQGEAGLASNVAGNKLAGSQGLAGLYGTNQGALNSNLLAQLGLFSGTNQGINQNLGTQAGMSNQPGTLESILGAIGGGIGGAIPH